MVVNERVAAFAARFMRSLSQIPTPNSQLPNRSSVFPLGFWALELEVGISIEAYGRTRPDLWRDASGVRARRTHPAAGPRHLEDSHAPEATDHGELPDPDGQRANRGLHRLSRAIQHHPRPGQGRHPVSP